LGVFSILFLYLSLFSLHISVKRQQRKHLLAAHNEIHKDGEGIIKSFSKAELADQGSTHGTPTNSEITTETAASFAATGAEQTEASSEQTEASSRPASAKSVGSRPASAKSSTERPPSGKSSHRSSARSEKAPSRKSSTHGEKPASRKSSAASQEESLLDLTVEGKTSSQTGSKPG
jgi:hypothetical protein